MDLGEHQQVEKDTYKTVAVCVVLILCLSIPASICVNRYFVHQKKHDGVEAFHFNLALYYDDVSECLPEAPSIGSLNSCIVERKRTRSFPFARLFYVVGSFLFLGLTLQLNLSQVSILVWGSIVLCNIVFIIAVAGGAP